jgi:hypothetical protein
LCSLFGVLIADGERVYDAMVTVGPGQIGVAIASSGIINEAPRRIGKTRWYGAVGAVVAQPRWP